MSTERPQRGKPHWRVLASCVAMAGLGFGSCTDFPRQTGSTVTVQYAADERAVGPNYDSPAQFLVFLPMVARNAEGEFEGRLARSWEPSEDYRHWTVHLNTEVRWHDGVPVTADDIAFTVELLSRPDVGYIQPGSVEITVIDDSTLIWSSTLGSPLSDYRTYYPRHLLQDLDPTKFYEWTFWTEPVGNGPYVYVRHVPKTMMEFEANPDYYRGKPRINRLIIKFGSSSLVELLSGNVDVLTEVTQLDLLKIRGSPDSRSTRGWRPLVFTPSSGTSTARYLRLRTSGGRSPWLSTGISCIDYWSCRTVCRYLTASWSRSGIRFRANSLSCKTR